MQSMKEKNQTIVPGRVKFRSMKKENKKLIEQMLTAIYAKDKLESIEELVNKTGSDKIDKRRLQDILEDNPDDYFNGE